MTVHYTANPTFLDGPHPAAISLRMTSSAAASSVIAFNTSVGTVSVDMNAVDCSTCRGGPPSLLDVTSEAVRTAGILAKAHSI